MLYRNPELTRQITLTVAKGERCAEEWTWYEVNLQLLMCIKVCFLWSFQLFTLYSAHEGVIEIASKLHW